MINENKKGRSYFPIFTANNLQPKAKYRWFYCEYKTVYACTSEYNRIDENRRKTSLQSLQEIPGASKKAFHIKKGNNTPLQTAACLLKATLKYSRATSVSLMPSSKDNGSPFQVSQYVNMRLSAWCWILIAPSLTNFARLWQLRERGKSYIRSGCSFRPRIKRLA